MKFSFVIPCYGSELTISDVISEIAQKMGEKSSFDYEIIAINDCSPDAVLGILKETAQKNPRVKVIDLSKNGGKHAAMMAGYSMATGDIIVNLDDDGQCPIDRLWDLIEPLNSGFDIVIAKYFVKKQSAFKNFGSRINALMAQYLIGKPKALYLSNFSAMKRFVLEEIKKYDKPYPYMDGLMLRTTSKICNVKMEERERSAGVGHYTFVKSLKLWLNGFTAFSVKPLRISSVLGAVCAFSGFVFGLITVFNKLMHPETLMGYSSLMAVLLFVGGMIMMMLGMIGEYVGRIYISINNSPQYVIRETINCGEIKE
jgi:glycosyltransferase involved in cell wall biosynthesis